MTFLLGWSESGPWWPAAMKPDKAPVVQTFTDPAKLAEWLAPRIGHENLYFHVNDLSPGVDKMAEKEDVTRIRGAHVDIDPRPIEGGPDGRTPEELAAHYAAEHARILRLVTDQPREGETGWPEGLERPTVIVDSGGGFQCFWLYGDDEEVPPDLADGINRAIAALVGGDDNVANVNRIMRLPGAVNVLSKSKRAKGRTPARTRLVWADWSRRFRVADLPAPVKPKEAKAGGAAGRVVISKDLPKVESLDDLPAAVDARTRMLIVNGDDPDDPARYPSRSEVLFAVLCAMVRAGVADDVMAAVILDPDHGISAHVLEQPRPHDYAQRQIQRAHDEAVDPHLAELNSKHIVIESMGVSAKCRIMERLPTPDGRGVVAFQSFEDFRNRYMHRSVVVGRDKEGNDVKMPLGKWWLQNAARRQHKTLVFLPGGGEIMDGDQFNLWQGFGVQPKAGDWSLMKQHIHEVLAGGVEANADYIVKWAAYAVQHPDRPAEAAVVFRGDLGTGKGAFGRAMLRIFGRHGVRTQGAAVLDNRFNVHLRDCCLLFADEVDWDNRRSSSQLKGMVTEESLFIEPKGVDATNQPNYLHIIIASNNEWVIPAAPGERRFAAFHVSPHRKDDKAYFNALFAEMDGGGLAAMLHDLLAMDLTGWHPRWNIPQTGELSAQKLAGLTGADAIAREVLMGAVGAGVERPTKGADRAIMVRPLIRWAIDNRVVSADPGERRMTDALKRMGCERRKLTFQNVGQRSAWALPPLAEARATWAENLGLTVDWPDDEDWSDFPG
ncbi:DUF5906 domain-containing protein [Rhodovulum tesquicola]|uniref:DUF5906 domain-containing protein n=1 Tax=Rhodovulum tesquicola TaxID=540254 RepID=UPI002096F08B|nr:DUF5906 domain-containing protein [Rhodovulum tesquicola]MCO8144874.1 DUF5906 domain-containing protein [Rhodovulum tesquicola]